MGKTEAGDEFRVFATVVAMMNKWISTVGIKHVESFDFGANKGEHASDGRAKLYTRFAKKLASQLGWKLEQSTTQDRSTAFFKLTNPKPVPREQEYWDALEENFADGKKKETIEETIRKQGDKYVIYSKDGKKKLGTYNSRKAAEKRLGQIEYFKHNENVEENVIESAGVGRVVKGVNTTIDVGVDEIINQVKKFGNDVDRDGKPKKNLR